MSAAVNVWSVTDFRESCFLSGKTEMQTACDRSRNIHTFKAAAKSYFNYLLQLFDQITTDK